MSRFETFDRDIRLATEGISQDAISAELAKLAKAELAQVIASGVASRRYRTFVNGREGAAEESVSAPGPIVYDFIWWSVVVIAALAELQRFAPVKSGRYRSSFVVLANRVPVADFESIPAEAEVVVTNVRPYTRKIQQTVVPLFHRARSGVLRKMGSNLVSCRVEFLDLPQGIHPQVPYILRGPTRSRRADRQPGQRITYPSLVMRMID